MAGQLIEGKWVTTWYDTVSHGGRFVRQQSQFRNWIGSSVFSPEKDRYHLYISHACPWAHRTHIFRQLKNLESVITLSTVDYLMGDEGWTFQNNPDPLYGAQFLHELYVKADPHVTGRVTVPVLWDKKTQTIVNNESSEIIQMLNSKFQAYANDLDFFPSALQAKMNEINDFVYHHVNNGVYKVGFATTQEAYDEAVCALFEALDKLELNLAENRYLLGSKLTAADWRLFTTLLRFDPVYVGHFKCNLKRIADYQHLSGYLRELYQMPGIVSTVNFEHIKKHYYKSHLAINPTGIVPKGPMIHLHFPHGRDRLPKEATSRFSAL